MAFFAGLSCVSNKSELNLTSIYSIQRATFVFVFFFFFFWVVIDINRRVGERIFDCVKKRLKPTIQARPQELIPYRNLLIKKKTHIVTIFNSIEPIV